MKIEKLNENQIRCTLTLTDLAARHLKLSELAYGSEKAKSLFRDMMRQASFDFGFDAEDIPLMIEAIPSSAGSIVLIITKVEDPEELDARFSKFTSDGETEFALSETAHKLEGADEFFDLLNKIKEVASGQTTPLETPIKINLYSFSDIEQVLEASRLIAPLYRGANTLYYDKENHLYMLALAQSDHSIKEFNKICNMLSEYATPERASAAVLAFLEEHCEIILSANALQTLTEM